MSILPSQRIFCFSFYLIPLPPIHPLRTGTSGSSQGLRTPQGHDMFPEHSPRRGGKACAAPVLQSHQHCGMESKAPDPALRCGECRAWALRRFRGDTGTKAVAHPRVSRGQQQAESCHGWGKTLACLQGGLGAISSLMCGIRGSQPPLWLPLSPGSQGSTMAKGQQQQRPSPAHREVAQLKASPGTEKVPRYARNALCPERLSCPSSAPSPSSSCSYCLTVPQLLSRDSNTLGPE